jgi:hypothetical protein
MSHEEQAKRNLLEAHEMLQAQHTREAVRALQSALHHGRKWGNKKFISKVTKAVRAARRAA